MAADQYTVVTSSGGRTLCYFLVGSSNAFSTPTTVLGDTFIRNYYVYHDMDEMRVGMYGDYMVYYESEPSYMWVIGVVVVAIILVGVIIGICIF